MGVVKPVAVFMKVANCCKGAPCRKLFSGGWEGSGEVTVEAVKSMIERTLMPEKDIGAVISLAFLIAALLDDGVEGSVQPLT